MYFDDFDFLCYDPDRYFFKRPMLERSGYSIKEKDGKVYVLVNMAGVAKSDILVEVKPQGADAQLIVVSGLTKNKFTDEKFSTNITFIVKKEMDTIEWELENGILTLEVSFKEPVKSTVKIISR